MFVEYNPIGRGPQTNPPTDPRHHHSQALLYDVVNSPGHALTPYPTSHPPAPSTILVLQPLLDTTTRTSSDPCHRLAKRRCTR